MTSLVAGVVLIPSGSQAARNTLTWYNDNVTDTVANSIRPTPEARQDNNGTPHTLKGKTK